MTQTAVKWYEAPLWKRSVLGAVAAVAALAIPELILLAITIADRAHDAPQPARASNLFVVAIVYPIAAALGGAIAAAFARHVRNSWQAGLTGFVATLPMAALIQLGDLSSGTGPHHVNWLLAVGGALLIGGILGVGAYRQ